VRVCRMAGEARQVGRKFVATLIAKGTQLGAERVKR